MSMMRVENAVDENGASRIVLALQPALPCSYHMHSPFAVLTSDNLHSVHQAHPDTNHAVVLVFVAYTHAPAHTIPTSNAYMFTCAYSAPILNDYTNMDSCMCCTNLQH
jgi:hypothetical protein